MRRFAALSLALALSAGATLVLSSCGGGEDAKLLPGNTAAEINENLDRVKQYAEEEECVGAENAVAEVNDQIGSLTDVDSKLVAALKHGAERLEEVVAGCEEGETEALSPASEAPSTEEEEEKIPPGQEKKAEKEREKEEDTREREEEKAEKHPEQPPEKKAPAEPPATPTPPPGEGGGTGAPGGVSPGEPVEGNQGGD